jgi:hypothetical protein
MSARSVPWALVQTMTGRVVEYHGRRYDAERPSASPARTRSSRRKRAAAQHRAHNAAVSLSPLRTVPDARRWGER